MKLSHFLIMLANLVFVVGLITSVMARRMWVLAIAAVSAGMVFGAYQMEESGMNDALIAMVPSGIGLAYGIAATVLWLKVSQRPDFVGAAKWLTFVALLMIAAAAAVVLVSWDTGVLSL